MSAPEPQHTNQWRVPVARLRTHNVLVDRLHLSAGNVLLDLGCGNGFTMATAATRVAGLTLVGVDVDAAALEAASSWLDEIGARHQLFCSDLDSQLPLPDSSASHVVCHDVLECLADPGALLVEANRVLQPGGTAVLSHVDYESVVIGGPDRRLTRQVVRAYADASDRGPMRSDSQMGRRLAALVVRSPLARSAVDAHVLVATDLSGPGGRRIEDIVATVRRGIDLGLVDVGHPEVDQWEAELHEADQLGEFFYSQTAYIMTAVGAAGVNSGRSAGR